jgi:hypothetical protein
MAILTWLLRQCLTSAAAISRFAAVLMCTTTLVCPANAATPEYEVKAVFLFNFTQFVEWPADAFANSTSPLVIGVLGEDPFGAVLDEAVRGEKVNGRSLVVQRYRSAAEINNCQLLFLSSSESPRVTQTLESLKGHSILTVSDIDGFAGKGGIIRMATLNRKIHLRINLDAAQAARLTLSSKLLRPAEIVADGED